MAGARYANVFQHLIVELPEQIKLYVIDFEGVRILSKSNTA